MKYVLLTYVIAQLISTAFGLAVIESVKPVIEKKLHDKGYILKNKNSLYQFNSGFMDILKGFIPFYYFTKSLSLIKGESGVDKAVQEVIASGQYVTPEEQIRLNELANAPKEEMLPPVETITFEKPEKYRAIRLDTSLYDTYETPIEYAEREAVTQEELQITPYAGKDKVVEHRVVRDDVTKADIAKAIAELDSYELEALRDKISDLVSLKKYNSRLTLEKEVA